MANENFDETLFLDAPRSNSSSSTYSSVNGRSATGNSDSDDDDRDDGATGGPHFGEEVGGGEGANAAAVPIDHGGANDEDDENNAVMTHDYGFKGWLIRTFNSSPTSSSCLRGRQKVRINDGNGYRMVDPDSVMVTKVPVKQIALAFVLLFFGIAMFAMGGWIIASEHEWLRGICVLLLALIAFAPGLYYTLLTISSWTRGDWSQFDPDD